MAIGYDRRQETRTAAPQIGAQQRVSGPGIGMPNARAPQIDTSVSEMLVEVAKFGSSALQGLIETRRKEDYLEGQALYAQGKTIDEVRAAGGNYYTKQGWGAMEAQNAGAMWAAAKKGEIAAGADQTDPEEYRQTLSKSIVKLTEGRDPESTRMVMEIANKYIPDIAASQMAANIEFRRQKTMTTAMDSITTLSTPIDREDMIGTLSRDAGPLAGMNDLDYSKVLEGGILKAYEQDNPNAHKYLSEAGMLNTLDAAQLARVNSAERAFKQRQELKANEAYITGKAFIIDKVHSGQWDLSTAMGELKTLRDQQGYDTDQGDLDDLMGTALSAQWSRQAEARAEAKADQRAADAERKANEREAARAAAEADEAQRLLAYQSAKMDLTDKLNRGEISKGQFMADAQTLAGEYGLGMTKGLAGDIAGDLQAAHNASQKTEAENAVIDYSVATNSYDNLTGDQKQKAVLKVRGNLQQQAQDAIASNSMTKEQAAAWYTERYHDFLDKSGLTDIETKGMFQTFLGGSIVGADGKVNPLSEQAFGEFATMYEKNPDLAMRHIQGDAAQAKARQLMTYLQGAGPGQYGIALQNMAAADLAAKQTGYKPEDAFTNPKIKAEVDEATKGFLEDYRVGFFDATLGEKSLRQYAVQNDASIDRALTTYAPVVETQIKSIAKTIMAQNPSIGATAATEQAISRVKGSTIYMGGSFNTTTGDKVWQKMFGADGAGKYSSNNAIPNEALYNYLRTHGEVMYGEDLFNNLKEDPELSVVFGPNGAMVSVKRQLSPGQKLFGSDNGWTGARFVPYRDMGMEWEQFHKDKLKADQSR